VKTEAKEQILIEYVRVLTEHLIAAGAAERRSILEQMEQAESLSQSVLSSWRARLMFDFQLALTSLIRGELARAAASVHPDSVLSIEEAKEHLRAAMARLETLRQRIQETMRTPPSGEELTREELLSFQRNVQFQKAHALKELALCYSDQSSDFLDSLQQALECLEEIAVLEPDSPVIWKSRLLRAECLRRLGETSRAATLTEELSQEPAPSEIRLEAKAEAMRLLLAQEEWAGALKMVRESDNNFAPQPDHQLARLEVMLALWREAIARQQPEKAETYRRMATRQADAIARLFSPYWQRRAQLKLARSAKPSDTDSEAGGDRAFLEQLAEDAYRQRRYEEAVSLYDRAAEQAEREDLQKEAFRLELIAASLMAERAEQARTAEEQSRRHEEAFDRYRRVAVNHTSLDRSPNAYLMALSEAGALVKAGKLNRQGYVDLLKKYLALWPTSENADTIRIQLSQLLQHLGEYREAMDHLEEIAPSSPSFERAVTEARRCAAALAETITSAPETPPLGESLSYSDLAKWFQNWGERGTTWNDGVARANLLAAEYWLLSASEEGKQTFFQLAEIVLHRVLAREQAGTSPLHADAQALLVYSLAGQGKLEQASELLQHQMEADPAILLSTLQGLSRLPSNLPEAWREKLARLQLDLLDQLGESRKSFSPEEQRQLTRIEAKALAAAGEVDRAIDMLQSETDRTPDDYATEHALAELLAEQNTPKALRESLDRWRVLARGLREGSPRWWEAKENIARLHLRLGNPRQTRKMIELLALLRPDLGGPEQKKRFRELLREANR
jgi:hypothetical protein